MGHVEGDVVQHWLVGIGVPLDQMPDFKACLRFPAVLRGLRNLFSLLSHASTSFSNLRATMDSGQHTMKYMKKIVP